ncbi:MAG: hypothetical protein OHK0036_00400 [Bacteroidia bacterium]
MFSYKRLLIVIFVISFFAFVPKKPIPLKSYPVPVGTLKISDNFYVDETEVTNFSYLEYIYWLKRVYGSDSKEYLNALPDTLVWQNKNTFNTPYVKYYLTHPAYKDFPVVGVSYKQAKDFCKWRSDRVFEKFLIKKKIIKFLEKPTPDEVFTIEKYFSGKYLNIQPDPNIQYYPEYSLPDSIQVLQIKNYVDSLIKTNMHKLSKYKQFALYNFKDTNNKQLNSDVINAVYSGYASKHLPISYLYGNLREWTDKEGLTFGGSWIDNYETIQSNPFIYQQEKTSAFTGFRCVCQYKKWGSDN